MKTLKPACNRLVPGLQDAKLFFVNLPVVKMLFLQKILFLNVQYKSGIL